MLTGLILLACSGVSQETPSWLLGRWQVAYNPGQDDNDILQFQQGNKISIETADGRSLKGDILLQGNKLLLFIQVGRRSIETQIQISATQDRLIFNNGAYYMKVKDPLVTEPSSR